MSGNESIRINKVLKEFNIGINTLVEFLKKKGIEIEASPGAKITPDTYQLIEKEFGKEQLIKAESKKVLIKVKDLAELESPVAQEPVREEEEPEIEEVFIKTNIASTSQPEVPKKQKPVAEKKVEEPDVINKPKVLYTIDLGQNSTPVENKSEEVKSEEVKSEEADVLPVSKEKEVERVVEKEIRVEQPVEKEKEVIEQKEKVENKAKKVEKKEEKPLIITKAEKEEKKEEKKEEAPVVIEHIKTKVEKLTGPKVSGQIDLSQFDKKKVEKSDDKGRHDKNKGKRERINKGNKEKVDINKSTPGGQNQNRHTQGGNQQRPKPGGKDSRPARGRERFSPVKTDIDSDIIQKQIKETYARMTEGKGKTKGSKHRREKREQYSQKLIEEQELQELNNTILKVTEFVTVNELATMMNTPVIKVIEACMNLGLMVSINQRLDAEALVLVAEEFGFQIEFVTADITEAIEEISDNEEDLVSRPPIVTVMGHVDHGKTSLLDNIRQTNVIAGEAGGITQHIGAYNVMLQDGRKITFLDTPGHEAFTAMRARGAKVTDLAIIIIAADDAIMPQTVEAINHAQAAGVPMIFAINKIDKPGANSDKIKEQLANMNILVEDWGGKYQSQEISAKKGLNIDKLMEKILLEADLLDLKANPNKRASGTIIESSLDKGRGYLATILVHSGTLRVGDAMLSGIYSGKIKAMFNERGQKIEEAGPSTPVSVLGLNGAPTAGEIFNVVEGEKEARDLANKREQLLRIQGLKTQKHITLEEIGRRIAIGNFQELNIIVKGDVDGSIEALSDSLLKLSTEEIHVNVIHKAVGGISESDVLLAVASNAIIIGFQVRPSSSARKLAEKEEIDIRLYSVIYDAINEVRSGIEGMLAPEEKEEVTATAEVRETFSISKVGTIAGCMVKEGKLVRHAKIRLIRNGIVIYTGELGSLKRFKDDVKEVSSGYDCGLNIQGYNDIKIGDIIEAYEIIKIKRTL